MREVRRVLETNCKLRKCDREVGCKTNDAIIDRRSTIKFDIFQGSIAHRCPLVSRRSSFIAHRFASLLNDRTNERTSYLTVVNIDATVTAVDDQLAGVV